MRRIWELVRQTVTEWIGDDAPRLAAALSYYTLFSLAPLLVIVIGIAGIVFGREAVRGEIVTQIEGLVGREGAQAIQGLIAHASKPAAGVVATVIGLIVLLVGAGGVFGELQAALNAIWKVEAPPREGIWDSIRSRLRSFVFVLGIGFLLLVSLTVSASLAAIQRYASSLIVGNETVWMIAHVGISVVMISLLFALMFKFLPDAEIAWSDVWVGAIATALFFSVGKFLVGLYLGRASFGSSYGAAGSLVIVLVWVYYSAQILFLGAELTQVYARSYGSLRDAQRRGDADAEEQARSRRQLRHAPSGAVSR